MKLLDEALRSAIARPAASTVAGLIIAGTCAVILSTTGQTVKAELDVLSRIDDAGTRSIVVTDTSGTAGIDSGAVARISMLDGVEWVIGLGPVTDVRAVANPGGRPVAIRTIYGELPEQVAHDKGSLSPGEALIGPSAQETLRLIEPFGGVEGDHEYAVVGGFTAADPLSFLNTGLISNSPASGPLRSVHVLVTEPSQVALVADAVPLVLGAEDLTDVAVETSETIAAVRAAVQGELGRHGRRLITLVLGASLLLTALSVYGAVNSRRRDFGRRRALGASRSFIVGLVAAQTGLAALTGAIIGSAATWLAVTYTTGLAPDLRFTAAIVVLAVLAAVIAALPPAVVAAYRDPVRVLRVP